MKTLGYNHSSNKPITYENNQRLITLYVGQIPIYGIYSGGIYDVYRLPKNRLELTSAIRLVLDRDMLTPEDMDILSATEIYSGVYDFEITKGMRDTVIEPEKIDNILPIIDRVYQSSIAKSATKPSGSGYYTRSVYFQDYTVEAIHYMQTELQQPIPEPNYYV
jgi:hypothetical protein